MLIPIRHFVHQVKEPYLIDINMIWHTVFTMFVDFKKWM